MGILFCGLVYAARNNLANLAGRRCLKSNFLQLCLLAALAGWLSNAEHGKILQGDGEKDADLPALHLLVRVARELCPQPRGVQEGPIMPVPLSSRLLAPMPPSKRP